MSTVTFHSLLNRSAKVLDVRQHNQNDDRKDDIGKRVCAQNLKPILILCVCVCVQNTFYSCRAFIVSSLSDPLVV